MKRKLFSVCAFAIILLACTALFFGGDYVVYILAYIFSFVFLLCYTVFAASTILEKIVQTLTYALILAAQIVFDVLVLRNLLDGNIETYSLGKFLGIALIFIPFFVKQLFFIGQRDHSPFMALGECFALSYPQLYRDKDEILYRIDNLMTAGNKLSKENLQEIIHDLPRHSSFSYINNGSLTENYFERAERTLNNGYVYLIITKSKSASGEVIGLFTNKQYNHISLSFDEELNTIISYNGGEKIAPPGLNPEVITQLTKREGASIILYRLPATYEQKKAILDKIRTINNEGSSYNILGLLLKVTPQPNIMFCSQFVYTMLELAGLNYFEKDAAHVTPTDFIELDYYRRLDFVCKIDLNKTDTENAWQRDITNAER